MNWILLCKEGLNKCQGFSLSSGSQIHFSKDPKMHAWLEMTGLDTFMARAAANLDWLFASIGRIEAGGEQLF